MYSILVASLNENVKLADILKSQLDELGIESQIINLIELNLPMYSSQIEEAGIGSTILLDLVHRLDLSKGYIIVSPEYNYSIPPVLTNTIAWISRVDGDFRKFFINKHVLLATHSGGGGTDFLKDIRIQLTKLGANVYNEEILTTYKKPLDRQLSQRTLAGYINEV